MAKMDIETIEKYRKLLAKDPNSKAFAPLAEALRAYGMHEQAETTAMEGIRRHPDYVGGYVVLGRALIDQERYKQAMTVLKKATEIDSQNLLALDLLGNAYLRLKEPQEALKCYKMILFLNPSSAKAKSAVQKLETLSAEEFEADIFDFTAKPSSVPSAAPSQTTTGIRVSEGTLAKPLSMNAPSAKELERKLSLIDALIVRSDLDRAKSALVELSMRAPGNPEIAKRFELLGESVPEEQATAIRPVSSREKQIIERKRHILETLLQRVRAKANSSLSF